MIQNLNCSISIEFFANVYQSKRDKNPYVSFVHGREVGFDLDSINTFT